MGALVFRKPKTIAELKFGRLKIIRKVAPEIYLCQCSCGNTIELWKSQLWCNVVRHCGCLNSEQEKSCFRRFGCSQATRHSRSFTKRSGAKCTRTTWEYNSWNEMNLRCYCKTRGMYETYGGRGIRVCDRWRRSRKNPQAFRNFLADMGPRPEGMTLDRINPQGHYEPTNCRWATAKVQRENQGRMIWVHQEPPPVESVKAMEAR